MHLDQLLCPKNTQCLLLNHVHRHIVCRTHIQPHGMPQHAIHAFLTYNTYTYTRCTIQHKYIYTVQHNKCIYHDNMTTQCTCIVLHACNIACTTCTQSHMYKAPSAQCVHRITCTRHNLHNVYTIKHVHCTTVKCVHNTTCMQYHMHDMYATPHVHSATCTTCTHHHLHIAPPVQHVHNTTST